VETYFKAKNGTYQLLELPERIAAAGGALPPVDIVDMRDELKAGNSGIFSRDLTEAVNEAISNREQVILFLNRRGGSTFIQCRSCGFVLRCRRCEVPLSHHISGDVLTCHQCGRRYTLPQVCPGCSGQHLKFLGTGTQKLEQEVRLTFPRARLLRWDSDTATGRTSHEDMLREFREGRADILIGTQMVAKGLDIPAVTLVGVINADTSLNLPDFRSGERTFQLVSQVAGRAGRGVAGGRVIFQTFTPEHYAVLAAAGHDYTAFYEKEIEYRRQLRNPPYTRLARLVFSHVNDAACRKEAERIKSRLAAEMETAGVAGIDIIGPAPAFIHRLRGKYRWHIILRGNELSGFLAGIQFPQGWGIDIDPVGLLR
ncbi:MAG: primosomal protein N', partial [Dehalococcoidales bacterium]|nr:primosomal protein N' [Dehalococcoidales bacterium]